MSQVQSGILPEHCRAAIWIEANVKGDVNALREASKIFVDKVATFQAKFPDAKLGAVVAFGNNVWRQLSGGEGAEEPTPGKQVQHHDRHHRTDPARPRLRDGQRARHR